MPDLWPTGAVLLASSGLFDGGLRAATRGLLLGMLLGLAVCLT